MRREKSDQRRLSGRSDQGLRALFLSLHVVGFVDREYSEIDFVERNQDLQELLRKVWRRSRGRNISCRWDHKRQPAPSSHLVLKKITRLRDRVDSLGRV